MNARRMDMIWLLGGVVVIVLMVAAGWTMLISSKYDEADEVHGQAAEVEIQLVSLRRQVAKLQEEHKKLPTYTAALKANQQALPSNRAVSDFLRQLQDSGNTVHVEVSGMSVGDEKQSTLVPTARELPITLTATGNPGNLSRFLNELQSVQPRAVLVTSASVTGSTAGSGNTTANLALTAFYTTATGTTVPTN